MQFMHSSNEMGQGIDSEKFAALCHVTRQIGSAIPEMRRSTEALVRGVETYSPAKIAEGAGLAHDAGNLLGALSLYSDLLAMPGVLHEEHREYAAELRMLSDRSWAMIDRLMSHARTGQSLLSATESTVLPDVAARCRGLLSRVAGRPVEISCGVEAFQPVRVPLESVERILTNLVKNAAEATFGKSAILIHVEGVAGEGERWRVILTVSDRGCGMDAATVDRLMRDGVSKAKGRGLGFRVVRELVAISGGCLRVESQPQVGTSISAEWYGITDAEMRNGGEEEVDSQNGMTSKLERGMTC
jgi:signal transduction histidine kinase